MLFISNAANTYWYITLLIFYYCQQKPFCGLLINHILNKQVRPRFRAFWTSVVATTHIPTDHLGGSWSGLDMSPIQNRCLYYRLRNNAGPRDGSVSECLLCMHNDLTSVSRTLIKNAKALWYVLEIPELERQRQIDLWGSLDSHPSFFGEF